MTVSPALAVLLAAGDCSATLPLSTSALYTESPACPLRPTFVSAATASEGVMFWRSGTVTVAAGSLPFETTSVTVVPSVTWRFALGDWSMTTPSSTLSEYW